MRSGFGTDKKRGNAVNLSKKNVLEAFPNVKTAFKSFPNPLVVSTTYTSNFAVYEESGGEFIISKWNNLIDDTQYLRQTNVAQYPAISSVESLNGSPGISFLNTDNLASVQSFSSDKTTIIQIFKKKVINSGTNVSLFSSLLGNLGGSVTAHGFGFSFDSLAANTNRENIQVFYRTSSTTLGGNANFSNAGLFNNLLQDFDEILFYITDIEVSQDTREINVRIRDSNLNNVFSASTYTVNQANLLSGGTQLTDSDWDSLFGSAGSRKLPSYYTRMNYPGALGYNMVHYFYAVYNEIFSDSDLFKIISIIKNMYGL